jgi:phage terminase large subunit-like protein
MTADGRMRHTEIVFSGPKKSGKTRLAAMIALYTAVVLAGQRGEIYCLETISNNHNRGCSRPWWRYSKRVRCCGIR